MVSLGLACTTGSLLTLGATSPGIVRDVCEGRREELTRPVLGLPTSLPACPLVAALVALVVAPIAIGSVTSL